MNSVPGRIFGARREDVISDLYSSSNVIRAMKSIRVRQAV
jgi:hypothetical protein